MAQYQPERSADDHVVEKGLDDQNSADHSDVAQRQEQIPTSYGAAGAGVEHQVPKKKGVIQMLKEKLTGNKPHDDPVAPHADDVVKHDIPHDDAQVEGIDKVDDAVTDQQKPGHVSADERVARDGLGNPVEEGNAVNGRDALNSDAAGENTPLSTGTDVKPNEPGHGLGGATNELQSTPEVLREDQGSQLRAHPQSDIGHGEDSSEAVDDGSSGVLNQNVNENLGYGDKETHSFPKEHHHLGADGAAPAVSSISPTVSGAAFPHQSHDISHRDPQSAYGEASDTPESNTSLDVLPTGRADAEAIDDKEFPSSVPYEGASPDHDMHQDSYHLPQSYDQRAAAHAPDGSEPDSLTSHEIKSSNPASIFHSGDQQPVHQSASADHSPDGSLATREPESDDGSSLQGTSQASQHDPMEVDHGHDKDRVGNVIPGSETAAPVDKISAHDQLLNDLTHRTSAERSNYPRQHEQFNRMRHATTPFGNDSQQEKPIDETDQLHDLVSPSETTQVTNDTQQHPLIDPLDRPNERSASPEHSSMIPQDQSQQLDVPSYAAPVSNSAQQYPSIKPLNESEQAQLNSSDVAPVLGDYAQQHPSMVDQSQLMNPSDSAPGSNYAQQHPSIGPLDQSQQMNPSDSADPGSNYAQQHPSIKPLDQSQQMSPSHEARVSNYDQQHPSIKSLDQSQQLNPSDASPVSNSAQQYPSTNPLNQSEQELNSSHTVAPVLSDYAQQHPSTKSLDQSQQLNPSDAAQGSPRHHHQINEHDRPQELNSTLSQKNTSSTASADLQTDLTPGRSDSTEPVTAASKVDSHNTNEHDRPQELNSTPSQMNTSSTASADLQTDLTPGRSGSTEPVTTASKVDSQNTNINSNSTSKATGQNGWPLPVHPSQIGTVHKDTEGNVIEGPTDDNAKKGGFMSKIKNKLHLGSSTDHGSRT